MQRQSFPRAVAMRLEATGTSMRQLLGWNRGGTLAFGAGLLLLSGCSKSEEGAASPGEGAGRGSTGVDSGAEERTTISSRVPRRKLTLEPIDQVFRNPERGFYRPVNALAESDLSWIEDDVSLYFTYIRLDDYRDSAISRAFLAELDSALALAKEEGAKWIVRFAYNFGPYPDSEPDASLSQILDHIEQLEPILRSHAATIATVQAGFIGAWGEWHSSTNGLDEIEDKETVLHALLEALPAERTVQVRYPLDLMRLYGETPRSAEHSWNGSDWARTAHHNDCFLAGPRDTGTYPEPTDPEVYKEYLAQHNLFTPMGGETCAVSASRSECATALEEMERLRFSFINDDYHPEVFASWTEGGCSEQMQRSLGYRLVVEQIDVPESVAPGDPLQVGIVLKNVGWAAPMNPRPVRLVLSDESSHHSVEGTATEVRAWLPGGTSQLTFAFVLPENWASENVDLGLWLPDADPELARDARYAIRLAHEGWDPVLGVHHLARVPINLDAPQDATEEVLPLTPGPRH